MTADEKLTKVHLDLPNHWATGGESMWAVDLGDDLYELRNVPFYAYGLNANDVVRAIALAPDLKPEVTAVVRRSGHRTLRLFFKGDVEQAKILPLLDSLAPLLVSFEGVDHFYFALDLEPGADIDRVRDVLDTWQASGWIEDETCDARVPGSFDDRPPDDADGRS